MDQKAFKIETLSMELRLDILGCFLVEIGKTSGAYPEERRLFSNLKKGLQINDKDFIELKNRIRPTLPAIREERQMNIEEFFIGVFDILKDQIDKEEIHDCLCILHTKMDCKSPSQEKITELCTELSQNIAEIEESLFAETEDNDKEEPIFQPLSDAEEDGFSFELSPVNNKTTDTENLFAEILDEACENNEADGIFNTDTEEFKNQHEPENDKEISAQTTAEEITENTEENDNNSAPTDENDESPEPAPNNKPGKKLPLPSLRIFFRLPVSPIVTITQKIFTPIAGAGLKTLKINPAEHDGQSATPLHRIFAAGMDSIIICLFVLPISIILAPAAFLPPLIAAFIWQLPLLLIFIYYCSFEGSQWQGTPGKILCGLKICKPEQEKPDNKTIIKRVLIRFTPAFLGAMAGFSLFLMNLLATIFSLLSLLSFLIIFGGFFLIFKDKQERKTLHDRLSGTLVLIYSQAAEENN